MKRLWVFYYSKQNDQLYRGYQLRWHRRNKYNFDAFNRIGNTDYFSYEANKSCLTPPPAHHPKRRATNDMLSKLPHDAVPCDANDAPDGWEICDHYPYVPPPALPESHPPTIKAVLALQPPYIRQYYEHIEFYHQANIHSTERSLYDFLHTNETLNIATDGGVASTIGSLGIVLSDDQLNRFCHTWGQASGLNMDSFRTEICAALAATRFLQIYYEHWTTITMDPTIEEIDQVQATDRIIASINIITDSASMIRKLDKMNEYPGAARSMVMDADFDVLYALHKQLNWFPQRPTLQWVPSHQDDATNDTSSLPPAAQLNIHADKLATLGLQRLLPSPIVPLDPSIHAQLHHVTGTITKRLMPTVRSICQLPALRRYYLRNFKWTRTDFENVDWMLFTPVYTKYSKKYQAFTHKYAMRKLPTGSRMERNGGNEESQCSTCYQAHEDDDHLFQCPKRPAYRRKIMDALNTLKKGMCPTLYYLFSNSILNYINGHDRSMASHPMIAHDPSTLDEYKTLLTQQARLGWDHLLRGKLSVLWRVYQRQYERQQCFNGRNETPPHTTQTELLTSPARSPGDTTKPKRKKKRKTDRFQQFIDSAFLAARQELWIARCDDRHRRVEGNCLALDTKVD